MCKSSETKRYNYVYKRRKLQRKTVSLLSEENGTESAKRNSGCHSIVNSIDNSFIVLNVDLDGPCSTIIGSNNSLYSVNPSISRSLHLEKSSDGFSPQTSDNRNSESVQSVLPYIREDKVPTKSSLSVLQKLSSAHHSGINGRCSSRFNIGHDSSSMKTKVEEVGECSSSDTIVAELGKSSSVKELCVSFLKCHGLLGGIWTTSTRASESMGDPDGSCSQSCKICGGLENPSKILICDLCEEAFHMSCCNPRVKVLPHDDEWYCRPCLRKLRKCARKNCTGKSSGIGGKMSNHKNNMSHEDLDPISYMLRENELYTSRARIGKDFQAEVPEWSGPVFDGYTCFDEPMELDPAGYACLNDWNFNKSATIGNWIQCRELIYKDGDDEEGTVCGKWRRAPLSEVQTDDWDCSCTVLWDPFHADCIVPQEMETDIVLKHLKYVNEPHMETCHVLSSYMAYWPFIIAEFLVVLGIYFKDVVPRGKLLETKMPI